MEKGSNESTQIHSRAKNWSSPTNSSLAVARISKNVMMFSAVAIALFVVYNGTYTSFRQILPRMGLSYFSGSKDFASDAWIHDENYYELGRVLEKASTKEKTVILTTLNDAWAEPNSIFDLFLESFKNGNNTTWLLHHLFVIALDPKAYTRCQTLVSHCYFLKTTQSSEMAGQADYMTPIYLDMLWKRLACLHAILSLGYNFISTDTDVMWFRDPFPQFNLDSDFQTSCDWFNGNEADMKNVANNGFVFVRSNNRTIEFYKIWLSSRHQYPGLHEQDVFNKIKDTLIEQVGLKVRFLDTDYFGGYCTVSKDFNKVCTMHANCCVGLDLKIADLNTTLEVWKNYLHSNQPASTPSHWGVPDKCHM